MDSMNHPSSRPSWVTGIDDNGGGEMRRTEILTNDDVNDILLQPFSTLEEPVMDTIMRDVRAVASKLKVVMRPLDRSIPYGYLGVSTSSTEQEQEEEADGVMSGDMSASTMSQGVPEQEQLGENQRIVIEQLKDWDLWGPLIVCLTLSVLLALKAPTNQASAVFAAVFVAVWVGSSVVTVNAQLLGGTISFFQSVCVLGYCVFPMTVAALIIGLLRLIPHLSWKWLDLIILTIAFLWATRASSVFIGMYIAPKRRFLAVYPVLFFYTFLGWLILLF